MSPDIFDNPIVFSLFRLFVHNSFKGRLKVLKQLNLSGDEKVIDICCGTGFFSQFLPKDYVGVDNNKFFIDHAKKTYGKNFILQDATNLKQFGNKSFDVAFVIDCLHHFPDGLASKVLSEACRLADKVFIMDLPSQSNFNLIGKVLEKLDRGKHVRKLDREMEMLSEFIEIEKKRVFSSGIYKELAVFGRAKS